MPAGDYIEGLAIFVAMLAACTGGAWLLIAKRAAELEGALRLLALALVATLAILAVHLLPAMLGLLSRASVLLTGALWLAGCLALPAARAGASDRSDQRVADPPATRPARLAAGFGIGVALALALAVLAENLTNAPQSVDLLNFHLPVVGRWIETGSIWQIDVFLPGVSPGHYPQNGDVILLAAVLPWRSDWLAHLAMYPYWALTGVAIYALCRELRAPAPAAALAAGAVLVVPAVAVPALSAGLVDALMLFGLATGGAFLVRHRRTAATTDLVLAGLALGVSFGTKWYAVWAVAIVLALWAVGSLAARRGGRRVLGELALLGGMVGVAGGVWLVRNLVESGNPFFPVEVAPLGVTLFDAPRDTVREAAGFTLLGYVGDGGVWGDLIWPQLRRALAWPAVLIGVGWLAASALWVARGRRRGDGAMLALFGLGALALLLAYAITPYSAGGPEGRPLLVAADARYAIPALLAAACFVAAIAGGSRWLAAALAGLAVPALLDGARWSAGAGTEAAALNPLTWGAVILIALAVAARWPAIAGHAGRLRERMRPGRLALVALAGLVLAGAGIAGYRIEQRYSEHRYLGADPVTDLLAVPAASGVRVGLAGLWDDAGISPVLPAFGPRYENRVEYVGADEGDVLRRYPSEPAFAAALERGEYDLLVVGRGRPGARSVPELAWARAAGYSPVALSERLALLRPPGAGAP